MLTSMLLTLALALHAPAADKADFYVALDGADTNPGTLEAPFATLPAAQAAVREKLTAKKKGSITVFVREGNYPLTTPLTFRPEDGGTKERAVTYAAYPGETVLLSGGRAITGWQAAENNRWTVTIPEVAEGTWRFRQLFADGQRLTRGRFPNAPNLMRVAGVSEDLTGIVVDQSPGVENLAGSNAELVMYQNWSISRVAITSSSDRTLKTKNPVGWIGHGNATSASTNKPTYVENALSLVDVPGEWYLDEATGVLTYQAAEGEDPNTRTFIAPVADSLLDLQGAASCAPPT